MSSGSSAAGGLEREVGTILDVLWSAVPATYRSSVERAEDGLVLVFYPCDRTRKWHDFGQDGCSCTVVEPAAYMLATLRRTAHGYDGQVVPGARWYSMRADYVNAHFTSCGESAWLAGVGFAMSRFANLKAAPTDVDFGSLRGLQFPYTAGADHLDVAVHVRPGSGTQLKAFQVKLGPLPSTQLNSASGASWTDGGSFSGIATQFDNPSTEVVLSASDTASSVSSQITLGTVRLNVVGSGVVLIEGEIANIVVQSASGASSELQYLSQAKGT